MKKSNTSNVNINTPEANQAFTSSSLSMKKTIASRKIDELLPNYSYFMLTSSEDKRTNNSNEGTNACCSVFFKQAFIQNFRNHFYSLKDNETTSILNLGLRIGYNGIYRKII